jgi:hypothetical protein
MCTTIRIYFHLNDAVNLLCTFEMVCLKLNIVYAQKQNAGLALQPNLCQGLWVQSQLLIVVNAGAA